VKAHGQEGKCVRITSITITKKRTLEDIRRGIKTFPTTHENFKRKVSERSVAKKTKPTHTNHVLQMLREKKYEKGW